MTWKEKKRAQGFKDVLVWLSPEAVMALDVLKGYCPPMSVTDIIAKCLVLVAHDIKGSGFEAPIADLGVKDRLDQMEARLGALEGGNREKPQQANLERGHGPVLQAHTSSGHSHPEPHSGSHWPHPRIPLRDQVVLLERIADRIERDDWNFNVTHLHRELLAEGIPVHKSASGFSDFFQRTKTRNKLNEILRARWDSRS